MQTYVFVVRQPNIFSIEDTFAAFKKEKVCHQVSAVATFINL